MKYVLPLHKLVHKSLLFRNKVFTLFQ